MASSFTPTFAVLVPTSLGVKMTVIVQLEPVPKLIGFIGQVLVTAKSLAFAPVGVMLEMMCAALSLLVRVTVIAPLVEP